MSLFGNIMTVGIMRMVLTVLILGSDIFVSRYLGVEGKGQYFFLITLILTFGNLFTFGLHLGNVYQSKHFPISMLAVNSIVFLILLGGITFGVGLPILSSMVFFAGYDIWTRIIFLACLFFESVWIILAYFYVAMDNLYQYSQVPILRRGIFFVLVILAFVFMHPSVPLVLIFYLTSTLGSMILMVVKFPWAGGLGSVGWRSLWESLKYGCRSQALVMADDLTLRINVILLGLWATASQTGLYSVALNYGQGFPVLAVTLGTVVQSAVSMPLDQQLNQFAKLFRHAVLLLAGGGLALALLAKPLIHYAYGAEFFGAVPLLRLLIPGMVCFALYVLIGRFMLTNGYPGIGFGCSSVGLLVNIGLAFFLIPHHGAVGAVKALLAGYYTSGFLFVIVLCMIYRLKLLNLLIITKEDVTNLTVRLKKFVASLNF